MVEINLLPWREQQQRYEMQKLITFIVVASVIVLLIIVGFHLIVENKLKNLNAAIEALQNEKISFTKLQHELEDTERRNNIIQQLEQTFSKYRSEMENLIVDLTKNPDKNMCFSEMSREKNAITFTGYARSIQDLTKFLKHWEIGELFSEIKIEALQAQPGDGFVKFRFRALEKNVLNLSWQDEE